MQETDDLPPPVQRFEVLYKGCYQEIFAYVWRRMDASPADVPDVVAEIFAVAWRRIGDLPRPPRDRLWLYGVGRRVVLDHQRRSARRLRLESLLKANARVSQCWEPPGDSSRLRVRQAVERLRPSDREALRLVAWEGLSYVEAAEVLGCSVNALSLRVHKAKARLRTELASPGPSHSAPDSVPSPHC